MKLKELFERVVGFQNIVSLKPGSKIIYPPVGDNIELVVTSMEERGGKYFALALHKQSGKEYRIEPRLAKVISTPPKTLH